MHVGNRLEIIIIVCISCLFEFLYSSSLILLLELIFTAQKPEVYIFKLVSLLLHVGGYICTSVGIKSDCMDEIVVRHWLGGFFMI